MLTPEHIEISCNHAGPFGLFDQIVECVQLMMPNLTAQRQMDQVHHHMFELQFDHQPFHAVLEEVEGLVADTIAGKERVTLFPDHRHMPPEGALTVLDRMRVIMAQRFSHLFCLILPARTI